ncbi:hypothetical protein ACTXT7_017326 [Hymenolepis weldensis]
MNADRHATILIIIGVLQRLAAHTMGGSGCCFNTTYFCDANFDRGGYVDEGEENPTWNAVYGNDSTFNNPPYPKHISVTFSPLIEVTHFDPNLSTLEVVTATH